MDDGFKGRRNQMQIALNLQLKTSRVNLVKMEKQIASQPATFKNKPHPNNQTTDPKQFHKKNTKCRVNTNNKGTDYLYGTHSPPKIT